MHCFSSSYKTNPNPNLNPNPATRGVGGNFPRGHLSRYRFKDNIYRLRRKN